MATRAKFLCRTESTVKHAGFEPQREYDFTAVMDDGLPEHERYAKYTPVGTLKITVTNDAVSFTPGTYYYLDITEAEK
jgi:hypothetical protein